MRDASSTPFVVALCLLAILASLALIRHLMSRTRPTLRSKIVTFIVGMVGAELSTLPALLVVLMGEDVLGFRNSGFDHWIVIAVYVVLTVYVIVRLFPWHEVEAMTADPDANLRDILTAIMAKGREPVTRRDERRPP